LNRQREHTKTLSDTELSETKLKTKEAKTALDLSYREVRVAGARDSRNSCQDSPLLSGQFWRKRVRHDHRVTLVTCRKRCDGNGCEDYVNTRISNTIAIPSRNHTALYLTLSDLN